MLPYLRAGLPASFARGGELDAARGVALLENGACVQEVRRTNFLARLDREQKAALQRGCEQAAGRVRAALGSSPSGERLNAAASRAWKNYEALKSRTLRPEQIARLNSVMEHDATHPGR